MNRIENLLGAAAVAVTDAQMDAMSARTGLHRSAVATILTLGQHDVLTISQMAGIVGISHSAMVRLIDGLERKSMLARQEGRTLREVAISLTGKGRSEYDGLRQVQASVLGALTAGLTEAERTGLESALSSLLTTLTRGRQSADHICRFCDEAVCDQDHCPVERQAVRLTHP